MSALAILAAATVGLMAVDGEVPAEADAKRVAGVLGFGADEVRPIGLDAQLEPWWAVEVRLAACAGMPGPDLDDAVHAADAQLADLEANLAVATLKEAVDAAPCTETWVDPGALKVALEWWGHAGQEAGDERAARSAYEQLVATDPGWRIRPPPGSGFETLYDTVRSEGSGRQVVTVALHGGAREVRWNGEAAAAPTARLELLPGRHLLQWAGPDGVVQGAWVAVTGRSDRAALVTSSRADAVSLLATGIDTEAGRLALELWLGALVRAHGLNEIVVVDPGSKPPGGYRVGGGIVRWSAELRADFSMQPDRMRVLVGGGYLAVQQFDFHYGDVRLAADVKLVGPLHLHIEGSLGTSRITHPRSDEWDGGTVLLPGVGLGLAVRKPVGLAQPWVAATGGLWSAPGMDGEVLDTSLDGALLEENSKVHQPSSPLAPRIFVDGGLDLVPGGQAFVVRVSGGAGWGLGFQLRAGVMIGGRFGS